MKDEALRLALEALKTCRIDGDGWSGPHYDFDDEKVRKARAAVKQALEQPEPEPRVWIDHRVHAWPDCFVMQPDPPHTSPLYTSPPKPEPLTDVQIATLYWGATGQSLRPQDNALAHKFARAIETAHGIKGEA